MSRVPARLLVLALAAFLVFPPLVAAQMTRGAISGTVRDASGALVPGEPFTATIRLDAAGKMSRYIVGRSPAVAFDIG